MKISNGTSMTLVNTQPNLLFVPDRLVHSIFSVEAKDLLVF